MKVLPTAAQDLMPCQIDYSGSEYRTGYLITNDTNALVFGTAARVSSQDQQTLMGRFRLGHLQVEDAEPIAELMKTRPDLLVGYLEWKNGEQVVLAGHSQLVAGQLKLNLVQPCHSFRRQSLPYEALRGQMDDPAVRHGGQMAGLAVSRHGDPHEPL